MFFFAGEIGRLVVGDEYVELFDVFSSFSVLRGCSFLSGVLGDETSSNRMMLSFY